MRSVRSGHRYPVWMGLVLALLLFLATFGLSRASAAPLLNELEVRGLLQSSWAQYKTTFIQADGRVIDYNGNISTSEGQAYAMLRALWMRDKATFDASYRWAKDNLQIPRGDHLFSWKWGQKADKSWGTLDTTSATDADQDIALALLLAAKVWNEPQYQSEAMPILNEIWDRLTLNAPLGRVLLPGDWPQKGRTYQINPSYFAPYAYRVFAEADDNHDWTLLIDSSYEIMSRAVTQAESGLMPDWVEISLDNDNIQLYNDPLDARSDFGYEAIRVYWRVALDALMNPLEKRATQLLKTKNMLPRYWKIRKDLPISITWDGIVRHPELQSGAIYGAVFPGLYLQDTRLGEELLQKKIVPNLKPGGQWNTKNDYYAQNWLWCGLGLYNIYLDPPRFTRGSAAGRLTRLFSLAPTEVY
ncbi:glycosyl hydrolase family 8 [Vampirovibrio chlorellavorus]|uniref:glycosyl hydrolase family 8 n=1 Tax=Vampirovibrio chlorellavorus TaxID=758823 RepID=UPI0026F2C021|nr:glycosyl hydrolase family 8 [Vampirovibrio chlorellavorus]